MTDIEPHECSEPGCRIICYAPTASGKCWEHTAAENAALRSELSRLREAYDAKCREFETAKEPVFAEGMRAGCEELMLEASRMDAELSRLEKALANTEQNRAIAADTMYQALAERDRLRGIEEAARALVDSADQDWAVAILDQMPILRAALSPEPEEVNAEDISLR